MPRYSITLSIGCRLRCRLLLISVTCREEKKKKKKKKKKKGGPDYRTHQGITLVDALLYFPPYPHHYETLHN